MAHVIQDTEIEDNVKRSNLFEIGSHEVGDDFSDTTVQCPSRAIEATFSRQLSRIPQPWDLAKSFFRQTGGGTGI
jgi:hypothetical protein